MAISKSLEELKKQALAEDKAEFLAEEKKKKAQKLKDEKELEKKEKEVKKEAKKRTAKSPIKKVESKVTVKPTDKIDPKLQSKRSSVTKVTLTDKEKLEDAKIKLSAIEGMIKAFPTNTCYKGVKAQMLKRVEKLEVKLQRKK